MPDGRAPVEQPPTSLAPLIRRMTPDDVPAVLELEHACFPNIPDERHWKPDQLAAHVEVFPEGQWIAEAESGIIGSCTNIRTTWARATTQHTWHDITGEGRLKAHVPDGDVLYGTEIMVHPRSRRRGVGRRLFNERFRYVTENGLRAFVTGGRLPGYADHAPRMTPMQYVEAVARGDLTDPVLTADLKWGLQPIGVLCGYMIDPPSLHHASIVVWENPERAQD